MTDIDKQQAMQQRLAELAQGISSEGIKAQFDSDTERAESFAFEPPGFFLDYSKTAINHELVSCYAQLADAIDFDAKRQALFAGEAVNRSEMRPALHMLLRDSTNHGIGLVDDAYAQQADAHSQCLDDSVSGLLAQQAESVRDIIHIGIGGSSLGTELLLQALMPVEEKRRIHFIDNVDAHHLVRVLNDCKPESTLVIAVSKTFTTGETLQNLATVEGWFDSHGHGDARSRFIAVTARADNAQDYGITGDNIVTFPDWVGGRYSVWSAVSLSAILLLGIDRFRRFLAGAAAMDDYFLQTNSASNACYLAAALDHFYANHLAAGSRAIFAYDGRLRELVPFLQQLETESNGKDRQVDGTAVTQKTAVPVWGGIGTSAQHSVFQLLHQGTHLVPVELILVAEAGHDLLGHQQALLANGLAQGAALLTGGELNSKVGGLDDPAQRKLVTEAGKFSGDRPSTTILLPRLDAYSLGALLAFYEHRTFCSGVLANINSFDQMGVELGKQLAKQIEPLLSSDAPLEQLDQSTRRLIERLRRMR